MGMFQIVKQILSLGRRIYHGDDADKFHLTESRRFSCRPLHLEQQRLTIENRYLCWPVSSYGYVVSVDVIDLVENILP